ncbi:MAG: hypothetical protein GAK29_04868 [Acinetobacter bereziniae]|uniref:Uncharacterized protein n=1 Tax=Acinetobacter bereziniae TaxID=106648 RepID=A0A833PAA2_ACIBZ|nr:MAG: hypothetical protein GAK29_04868 [Acinetobacter bereziniae]
MRIEKRRFYWSSKEICYKYLHTYLVTFDTTSSKLFFITLGTIDFLFTRNEALSTDGYLANTAAKAFFMPLSGFVFHFFSSYNKRQTLFKYPTSILQSKAYILYLSLKKRYQNPLSSFKDFSIHRHITTEREKATFR